MEYQWPLEKFDNGFFGNIIVGRSQAAGRYDYIGTLGGSGDRLSYLFDIISHRGTP